MSDSGSTDEERIDAKKIEKEEEAKLKAKYPSVQKPGSGFLQKRLQKGQKYFDSGDYNMAKAAVGKGRLPVSALSQSPSVVPSVTVINSPPIPTGDTIPTPECVPVRKTSIHVPSKLAAEFSQS